MNEPDDCMIQPDTGGAPRVCERTALASKPPQGEPPSEAGFVAFQNGRPHSFSFNTLPDGEHTLYTAQQSGGVPAGRKLIGWRTSDYLMETDDAAKAKSWANHLDVLPIFEGDENTKLAPSPSAVQPLSEAQHSRIEADEALMRKLLAALEKFEESRELHGMYWQRIHINAIRTRLEKTP